MVWDTDWLPVRLLSWFGRVLLVGLLVLAASLPLVTVIAAVTGGASALRGGHGSVISRFTGAFRSALRSGIPISVLVLFGSLLVVVDVLWATSQPLGPLTTVVLSCSLLLGWLVASIGGHATVLLASPADKHQPALLSTIREAALRGMRSPWRSAVLALVAIATIVVAWVSPPLIVPALGLACAIVARLTTFPAGPGSLDLVSPSSSAVPSPTSQGAHLRHV